MIKASISKQQQWWSLVQSNAGVRLQGRQTSIPGEAGTKTCENTCVNNNSRLWWPLQTLCMLTNSRRVFLHIFSSHPHICPLPQPEAAFCFAFLSSSRRHSFRFGRVKLRQFPFCFSLVGMSSISSFQLQPQKSLSGLPPPT